jgi:hypothetical protein
LGARNIAGSVSGGGPDDALAVAGTIAQATAVTETSASNSRRMSS